MPDLFDIYQKACASPNNFPFSELCRLIEGVGFEFRRQKGSHMIFKHPHIHDYQDAMVNVQDFDGKAKAKQVRIVLEIIEKYGLLK